MSLLHVEKLSKRYYDYPSQIRRILSWFFPSLRPQTYHTIFDGITFLMEQGETIAIVGQNGAGKSTLLKIIAGIIQPTEGSVERQGKIAAILELGMGFSLELTGRQNVRHTASLMGYTNNQIDEAMEHIRDFAELGDNFDLPIRIYSSGMQMRLAFSVATAFTPDLLIIDEALSVGDTYFQHKSFERIRQLKAQGTSLLFVSHDAQAVMTLCDRALLIDQGRLLMDAKPDEVMDRYNALVADKEEKTLSLDCENGVARITSGTKEAFFSSIKLLDNQGSLSESFEVGEQVTLVLDVSVAVNIPRLVVGFMIKDRLGQPVYGTNTWHTHQILDDLEAQNIRFEMAFDLEIGPGEYSISVALVGSDTHLDTNYEWRDRAILLTVVNTTRPYFVGVAPLEPAILIHRNQTC